MPVEIECIQKDNQLITGLGNAKIAECLCQRAAFVKQTLLKRIPIDDEALETVFRIGHQKNVGFVAFSDHVEKLGKALVQFIDKRLKIWPLFEYERRRIKNWLF